MPDHENQGQDVDRRRFLLRAVGMLGGAALFAASFVSCKKEPTAETSTPLTTKPTPGPTGGKATTVEAEGATQPELKVGTTLENLQAAFNGESNAHARYVEFAKKADEDGYKQVARLFRATARSEEVHATNHKAVIEEMSGTAEAAVKPADVKSTKENLQAAYDGEMYEQETMYPEFLKVAQADKDKGAIKTLNRALKGEVAHATLYKQAMDDLEGWKALGAIIHVCPVCGLTVDKLDFEDCPICDTPSDEFEAIE